MNINEGNMTHNVDMEREVLASCIFSADTFYEVQDSLSRELFTLMDNIKVYDCIVQVVKEGKSPELTEVAARLFAVGVDARLYMTSSVQSIEMTKQRVAMLNEMKLRRDIYALCFRGLNIANDPTTDIDSVNDLVTEFAGLMSGGKRDEMQSFGDVLKDLLADIAQRKDGTTEQGYMTGLHLIDSHFGCHDGDLIIIAGETSQGKSTLATTIARNMARRNIPVAYYSLEMSNKQLAARILAGESRVPASTALYGKVSDAEYAALYDKGVGAGQLPIYFDERNKTTFTKICASIRRMVKTNSVKVVFIDYLQILANGGRLDSREQIIGDMARDLKRLAVELNICIVALSQMARSNDAKSKEPTLSRMRGSGQIEEACDMALLVYRPAMYGIKRYNNGSTTEGTAKLILAKGRNVGLGAEVVKFNSELSYFEDFEQGERNEYVEHEEKLPF